MSKYAVMPLEDYKRACNYIRHQTDTTENIKSGELVEKIDALYIKANSKGIQSGYSQGQLNAVQSAEALKGSLSVNNIANITDISPYKHKLECSVDRMNMFYQNGNLANGAGVKVTYDKNNDTYTVNGTTTGTGNLTLSTNLVLPDGFYYLTLRKISGTVTVNGGLVMLGIFKYGTGSLAINARPTIYPSSDEKNSWSTQGPLAATTNISVFLQNVDSGGSSCSVTYDNFTFKIGISKYGYTSAPYVPDLSAVTLKVGASADDENAQTFTCNADGSINGEISSIYPEMVISTDTSGIRILATYTKDIDAAFNALSTAIAMSGGE